MHADSRHILAYCLTYVPRVLGAGVITPFVSVGLGVALAVTVLLIVLGATSFNNVKARMSSQTWFRVQKWSYVFFGLTYAHVLAMLLPSALSGGMTAAQSVVAYTVVFGAYAVLRIVRAILDRKRGEIFSRLLSSNSGGAFPLQLPPSPLLLFAASRGKQSFCSLKWTSAKL